MKYQGTQADTSTYMLLWSSCAPSITVHYLFCAASHFRQGHLPMVALLLQYGADPQVQDDLGKSCTDVASMVTI